MQFDLQTIESIKNVEYKKLFKFLIDSQAQIVGSRYLGLETENSDYDYMLVHTPELEKQLEDLGLFCAVSLEKSINNDDYDIDICTHSIWIVREDNFKIDIQLVKGQLEFDAKMYVYDLIRDYDICKGLDKENRKIVFVNMLKNIYTKWIASNIKNKEK